MNKGFINFISFAHGIQHGFSSNNIPLLSEAQAEQVFGVVLSRFSFSMDVEKDILNQFKRGEIDSWDAIEQLEDECNLSYDEACKLVKLNSSVWLLSGLTPGKRRKRSKYHGSLVNNTFDDIPGGIATSALTASSLQSHPSTRYLAVNHMMHHSRRHLVKSSLSGTLDTFLLQNYCAGLGTDEYGNNIKHTGDNGRVVLSFTTEAGSSTEVDLGGSLGTGYVVAQINDELGLFPDDTEVGDLIDNAVIQDIVRSQGERDSQVKDEYALRSVLRRSSVKPIFSMAFGKEESVPDYVRARFKGDFYDGWLGQNKDVQNGSVFARYMDGEDSEGVNFRFYFLFGRENYLSSVESPAGNAFKFKALFIQYGDKYFARKFQDSDFDTVERSMFKYKIGVIEELGLEEVNVASPLVFANS